jgi:pimeloyl-ACP methyl ester carboxylesterase
MSPLEYLAATWHDPGSPYARPLQIDLEDNDAVLAAMLERAQSLGTAGKFLWPIPDRGLRKRLHRIQAPTLLVWGHDDRLVAPAYGDAFQRAITGSQLVPIPACGHTPMLEQPEAFVAAVRTFLEHDDTIR